LLVVGFALIVLLPIVVGRCVCPCCLRCCWFHPDRRRWALAEVRIVCSYHRDRHCGGPRPAHSTPPLPPPHGAGAVLVPAGAVWGLVRWGSLAPFRSPRR
jgi:hypothetical protein